MTLEIHAIIGDALSGTGPSYTFGQLAQSIASRELPLTAYSLASRLEAPLSGIRVREAVEPLSSLRNVPLRILRRLGTPRSTRQLLAGVRAAPGKRCVWTFGNVPLELMQTLYQEGIPVVREKYNCAQRVARDILAAEYNANDFQISSTINDASIRLEEESLRLADAVFAPSPLVARSLHSVGLSPEKIIDTSYGWEPARFPRSSQRPCRTNERLTILFLGLACVRKGSHILLEAWRRAGIAGELLIVGNIEPTIAKRFSEHLALPTVKHIPFTNDVEGLLRQSDWMVFPTLEEGSPLVSYESLGNWVPMITTAMGAGSLVRDNVEGIVIERNTVDIWADILRSLPDRRAQRDQLAEQAHTRALDYTWTIVGARRRAQLLARFG